MNDLMTKIRKWLHKNWEIIFTIVLALIVAKLILPKLFH